MVVKARGPYTFVTYTGVLGVTAKIAAADGKYQIVSVLNLLPMHPATVAPRPSQDESSDVSLSDSDTEAPEIINPPPSLPRDGADCRLQPGSGPPQPADSSTAGPAREHRK